MSELTLDSTAEAGSGRRELHDAEQACLIIYSSGTTGVPKGIVHSHRSRLNFAAELVNGFELHSSSRALVMTAPFTNGSWMVVLPTVATGGTVVIRPGFDAASFIDTVRREQITFSFVVPTMASRILAAPELTASDWSSVEMLLTAGAPMDAELKRRMQEVTGSRLGELWGFTEGVATCIAPRDAIRHPESVGRPVMNCRFRVIDQDGAEVSRGELGELVGCAQSMMTEYHNRPDATAEIIWIGPDGCTYLRTGDLGVIDDDGWISVRGRSKDMIISGGLNVFPIDIEAVLLRHPKVSECAVVGVPHPSWGERPVACVVLSGEVSGEELRAWVNERLAPHQRVIGVIAVDSLPRNSLGKVQKFQLRKDVRLTALVSVSTG